MTYAVTVSGTTFDVSVSQVGQQGVAGASWQGAWTLSTDYVINDVVSNGGSSYICILAHTSASTDEPGVGVNTATYWAILASGGADGADGTGFTGGSYDGGTGVVTFTSDDGLGFSTGDLRGADGLSVNWQGDWALSTAYALNDSVAHNGSSYICIQAHTSSATDEPGVGANTATYWEVLAEKGADGSGSGTVTSIDVAGGTGLTSSGGPITSIGTITVALDAASQDSLALADSALQSGDNISVLTNNAGYITDVTGDNLSALADVTITTIASGELLKWNGSAWINSTIAEAGLATAAQGDLADSALQSVTGTVDEIVVTGGDTISLAAAVTTSLGLADTATQPGDLATVATTGAYSDLSGTPTLGTMAAEAAADYLAVAGDAMTGDLTVLGVIETEDASSATTYAMDPTTNGTRATLTLTAATTLTDSLSDGEHISLRVLNGDTHAVTWVAGTLWVGGSAPTLTGDDRVTFEKWGTDLIGYVGLGIA